MVHMLPELDELDLLIEEQKQIYNNESRGFTKHAKY